MFEPLASASRGSSLRDICAAATGVDFNTFINHYKLRMGDVFFIFFWPCRVVSSTLTLENLHIKFHLHSLVSLNNLFFLVFDLDIRSFVRTVTRETDEEVLLRLLTGNLHSSES